MTAMMSGILDLIDENFADGVHDGDIKAKSRLAQCLSSAVGSLSLLQREALAFSKEVAENEGWEQARVTFLERLFAEDEESAAGRGANRLIISALDKNEGATAYMLEYLAQWSSDAGLSEEQIRSCIRVVFPSKDILA